MSYQETTAVDARGNTALMFAAIGSPEDSLLRSQELVAEGADIDAQNAYGNTALILAVMSGNNATATFLMKSGADVTLRNNDGLTVIDIIDNSIEIRKRVLRKLEVITN